MTLIRVRAIYLDRQHEYRQVVDDSLLLNTWRVRFALDEMQETLRRSGVPVACMSWTAEDCHR